MDYARHEAFLDSPVLDSKGNRSGGTNREHLEIGVRKGNARAIGLVNHGIEIPESVAHLWEWSQELRGQSGFTKHGFNPLTFSTIKDWSALTDTHIQPHEVRALLQLDAILLNPPKESELWQM